MTSYLTRLLEIFILIAAEVKNKKVNSKSGSKVTENLSKSKKLKIFIEIAKSKKLKQFIKLIKSILHFIQTSI